MKLLNKLVLFDIDYTLFDTTALKASDLTQYSLYDEVKSVLVKSSKIAELGIFSKGESEFQKAKLQKTGIVKFFQTKNIHIFENKNQNLKEVIKQYGNCKIYLIDDKLEILYNAKQFDPSIFTIWIKRGPFAQDETFLNNFSPDATITNLKEAISIVSD
ncbi:MAG TPA: hypothetical protein VMR59_02920 [Patescibacteria group bacterium]|jgi:FMN phosphatase YigB (HAD superfamily)|nr:hypothetical protein [Patescibacteria group bacterium]